MRNLGVGLRHVAGRAPDDPVTTDDLGRDLEALRAARAVWCAENGCYRIGKTCREAYGVMPQRCQGEG
ncbi:hypothetical protein ACN267_32150 [Micromonospora sp. WMMD734]|uniref:hypothetical protein n=1 Tax=Micromonospora sp. WMMD734 TaxID=3404129 RepID=UPI003B935050